MRFDGWGEPGGAAEPLPDHAAGMRARELDLPARGGGRRAVALGDVRLGDPALPDAVRAKLADAIGAEHVRDDREARVLHAAGKSYPDLVRMRAGEGEGAPDAVVLPGSHDEVAGVLRCCATAGVAVVPF